MFRALVDDVRKRNLVRGPLEISFYLSVKVSLLLKKIHQVTLALPHQVSVDRALVINGNQLSLDSS